MTTDETTVLLLDAQELPEALEQRLEAAGAFVEQCAASELAEVAPVLVPDLVVQAHGPLLSQSLTQLAKVSPQLAYVLVADQAATTNLPESAAAKVGAVVPQELPVAALAHRILTMAKRAAAGEPLSRIDAADRSKTARRTNRPPPRIARSAAPAPSRAKPQALATPQPVSVAAPRAALRKAADIRPKSQLPRKSQLAKKKSVPRAAKPAKSSSGSQTSSPLGPPAPSPLRPQTSSPLGPPAPSVSSAGGGAALVSRPPGRIRKRPEKTLNSSPAPPASAPRPLTAGPSAPPPAALPPPTALPPPLAPGRRVPPPPLAPSESLPAAPPTAPTAPQAATPPPQQEAQLATSAPEHAAQPTTPAAEQRFLGDVSSPELGSDAPSPKDESSDEVSVVAPLPVDVRMPLSELGRPSDNVRLVLLDTDLTRADRLATSLRGLHFEVLPVTPDADITHWASLRKFSPEGLLVDEKSLPALAADWVEIFRGDVFLRHVPLIVTRFSRLDLEKEGVDLAPLLPLLEPLGQDERALLSKLAPGHQVDLRAGQIAPYRLVQLLTEQDKNIRLDCRSDRLRVVWHLGPGYAGTAKQLEIETDKVQKRLTPTQALHWFVQQELAQLTIIEHDEPLAHPSESLEIGRLLDEVVEAYGIPDRHQSLRPKTTASKKSPAGAVSRGAGLSASKKSLAGNLDQFRDVLEQVAQVLREKAQSALLAYRNQFNPIDRRWGKTAGTVVAAVLPLLALVLLLSLASSSDPPPSQSEATGDATLDATHQKGDEPPSQAAPADEESAVLSVPDRPQPKQPELPAPTTPVEQQPGLDLFKVAQDSKLPSCENLLGPDAPTRRSIDQALIYWRMSRQALVHGKLDKALQLMCKAGLSDQSGPAAAGLAEHYLAERSLNQAERWIGHALSADPGRRVNLELMGDIENQKGHVEKSRKLWLTIMKLKGDEIGTLKAIARKLMADARAAQRGGAWARAERELRRAATLSPDDALVATKLGEVFLARGLPHAAARWASRAKTLDPQLSDAKLLYSAALGQLDHLDN